MAKSNNFLDLPLSKAQLLEYQQRLLIWFEAEAREFPWRKVRDPYAVLIAEKLLQQTVARSQTVAAFDTLLNLYPNPQLLADADLATLEAIVAPLGLRYRARELKMLAKALVDRYGGHVPLDFSQLLALPGVGDYMARAVLCFAHGQDVPIVDTNVARLLYRVFDLPGLIPSNPARSRRLTGLAATLVPRGKSREYNLAVLDLCASICIARTPKCSQCPIRSLCCFGKQVSGVDDARCK